MSMNSTIEKYIFFADKEAVEVRFVHAGNAAQNEAEVAVAAFGVDAHLFSDPENPRIALFLFEGVLYDGAGQAYGVP